MKIIQTSDFHISETTDMNLCYMKLDKLYDAVSGIIDKNESIIFLICGDIIDRGEKGGFTNAKLLLDYTLDKFRAHTLTFEFVPGNHDMATDGFGDFDGFMSKYLNGRDYSFETNNVVISNYNDLDLILANSTYLRKPNFGQIDPNALKLNLKKTQNSVLLVTHHTMMSRYADDSSALRNAYELVQAISGSNVSAILHGHTHGYSDVTVGGDCNVIGVGPLFKSVPDIYNQFNLISVVADGVDRVVNYSYRADISRFTPLTVFTRRYPNIYCGTSIRSVYDKVAKSVKAYGLIKNFNMCVNLPVSEFFQDIESGFSKEIDTARQWLAPELPPNLYYNHAQFINRGSTEGMTYILEEINRKATSSRAILPLINVEDVIKSEDGFLPSLDIIQFGFEKEEKTELSVSVYLRALEVKHFLKINLCEIYLLVKALKEKIRSIVQLDMNIFAFRTQHKEEFGCFRKAKLDALDSEDLMVFVVEKRVDDIIELLSDKKKLSETVVIDSGVLNLLKCFEKYGKYHHDGFYSLHIIKATTELCRTFAKLKKLRASTSVYQEISETEAVLSHQMDVLLNLLTDLGV